MIILLSFLTLSCTGKAVVEEPHPLSDKERRMIVDILHHDLQGPERHNLIKATFPLILSENFAILNQSKIVKKSFTPLLV